MYAIRTCVLFAFGILSSPVWAAHDRGDAFEDEPRRLIREAGNVRLMKKVRNAKHGISRKFKYVRSSDKQWVYVTSFQENKEDSVLNRPLWWALLTASSNHEHFVNKSYVDGAEGPIQTKDINWMDFVERSTLLPKNERFSLPSLIYQDLSDWLADYFIIDFNYRTKRYFSPNAALLEKIRQQLETLAQWIRENQQINPTDASLLTGFVLFPTSQMEVNLLNSQIKCNLLEGTSLSWQRFERNHERIIFLVEDRPRTDDYSGLCNPDQFVEISLKETQTLINDFVESADEAILMSEKIWLRRPY